jgi:hypothetical protein
MAFEELGDLGENLMRWNALAAIVIAFTLSLASATQAETVRIPKTGVPAFSFNAPAGWRIVYDQHGNLQFYSPDKGVRMQLSIIIVSGANPTLEEIAAAVMKGGGFSPVTRQQAGAIAGRAGQTFIASTIVDGALLSLDITLVRLDGAHVASLARVKRFDATRADVAALDALISAVRFTGIQ